MYLSFDMEDFGAPSFSLGFEEEIHESFGDHAVIPPTVIPCEEISYISAISSTRTCPGSKNEAGDPDHDSDFDLSMPISGTERILKRPRRKSSQSLVPLHPKQHVHHTSQIGETERLRTHDSTSRRKMSLPEKTLSSGSKLHTLQDFWKGSHGKITPNVSVKSNTRETSKHNVGPEEQGFGQGALNLCSKSPARDDSGNVGASQDFEEARPNFLGKCFTQHSSGSKAELCLGYAESPHYQKGKSFTEPFFNLAGSSMCEFMQSPGRCTHDKIMEGHVNGSAEQSRVQCLEKSGNRSYDLKAASLYEGSCTTIDKANVTLPLRKSSDVLTSGLLDDHPLENEFPIQSSWRSLDLKNVSLPDDSVARNESLSNDNTIHNFQASFKGQSLECTAQNAGQSKTSALESFWRSLNDKKSTGEEDDIEDCSSDSDFEIGTQSARKLSLCGNNAVRKSAAPGNATRGRTLCQNFDPNKTFCKASLIESDNFQYPSMKHLASNARASPSPLALQNVSYSSSANPKASQAFADRGSLQVSPMEIMNKLKRETMQRSFNDGNSDDAEFISYSLNESTPFDRKFDEFKTPTRASKAKASASEGNFRNPIAGHDDPRVADLLQCRFPHFVSVSTLRQGDYTSLEQVYIDYEKQFSGGKVACGQMKPTTSKQQVRSSAARPTTKWRQAAKKKQKVAMADNDGWIQTGNRNPARSSKRGGHSGNQQYSKTPVNTNGGSGAGAGHWVTERTGTRIYISKDGRKLSGSSAYKQHIKDSGKHFKKTKRRRRRAKK